MRWYALWLAVMLAGCSGAGPGTDDVADPPGTDVEDGNGTSLPVNTAPTVVLNVTGAGLDVAFTFVVSDAEGGMLNWTLDADGDGTADHNGTLGNVTNNGTSLRVNHTYAAPGNFTAVVAVSDGNLTASAQVAVSATSPPAVLPGQQATGSFYAGGATLIGCFGDLFDVGYPAQFEGLFYDTFEVAPHTFGYDYTAAVSTGTAQDSPGFAFLAADRSVITSGFMNTHASGTVPDGAALGVWWTCAGGLLSGTFESTPPE